MGNAISVPDWVPSENDLADFIRQNPSIFSGIAENFVNSSKKRRINTLTNKQWWDTKWGKLIKDENIRDINSKEGKEFRRRFRLPAPFFLDWLVPKCIELKIFNTQAGLTKSWHVIPVEIKILISLRLLARGNVLDDVVEFSGASIYSVWSIFRHFVTNFSKAFSSFINMPEGDDLESVLNVYSRLGFPGCVGSIDCTHIKWLGCPSNLTNICTGKEGYPTLSFQVIVDHARQIRHISRAGWGTMNDINMCQQIDTIIRDNKDGFINDYGRRNKYKEVTFTLLDNDGQPTTYKGAYLICDGGYEGLCILINPNVTSCERSSVIWAEFMESVRKDVECTFGILKNRFHILRAIKIRDKDVVENTFKTCCILHNMLLQLDGYDISAWEMDAQWDSINMEPDEWELPDGIGDNIPEAVEAEDDDDNQVDFEPFEGVEEVEEVGDNQVIVLSPARRPRRLPVVFDLHHPEELKKALIEHFAVSFRLGRIQWPKNMGQNQRSLMNRPSPITETGAIMRALSMVRDTLYIKESNLRLIQRDQLLNCIGKGLFTSITIRKGEIISDFVGEFITEVEGDSRTDAGVGGYQVKYERGCLLDCYKYLHVCKCSYANSPVNCFDTHTGTNAISNATISIDYKRKKISLKATHDIGPDTEILFNYGPDYIYPDV